MVGIAIFLSHGICAAIFQMQHFFFNLNEQEHNILPNCLVQYKISHAEYIDTKHEMLQNCRRPRSGNKLRTFFKGLWKPLQISTLDLQRSVRNQYIYECLGL